MLVAGIWHVLLGISAIAHDGIYVATAGYLYSFDLTTHQAVRIGPDVDMEAAMALAVDPTDRKIVPPDKWFAAPAKPLESQKLEDRSQK